MNAPWSEGVRPAVREAVAAILRLPFFTGIREGTLPRGTFENYLRRDAAYLVSYAQAMRRIASRLTEPADRELFTRFADEGVAAERDMQGGYGVRPVSESATEPCLCARLIRHAAEAEPLPVALAAVFPCFEVYAELGTALRRSVRPDNPYRDWVLAYSNPSFAADAKACAALCDRFAAQFPEQQPAMTAAVHAGLAAEQAFFTGE